jgi:hypothetical protein
MDNVSVTTHSNSSTTTNHRTPRTSAKRGLSVSSGSLLRKRRNSKKFILECTACDRKCDAEVLHPKLQLPICGACYVAYKNRDKYVHDVNEVSCLWCGSSDGCELLMCDTCTTSFCTNCVTRNLGAVETAYVRALDVWSCYCCHPTPIYTEFQKKFSLKLPENSIIYSLETIYSTIRPPSEFARKTIPSELIDCLSEGEAKFASLFSSNITTSQFQQLNIVRDYLTGPDIFSVIYGLSKSLRTFFQFKVYCFPGLFQTLYGNEYHCRLHDHQLTSLHAMLAIENNSSEFGTLRGGIFADEPGLGKTVTILALITATMGILPKKPPSFHFKREILETQWKQLNPTVKEAMLLPVLSSLMKNSSYYWRTGIPGLKEISRQLTKDTYQRQTTSTPTTALTPTAEKQSETLADFENKGKLCMSWLFGLKY